MSSYQRDTIDPRISIVVPALNEALNLAAVLPQLPDVHEVILVDGGSVDGTIRAARRAMPGIITVLQQRTGKGNALAAGFARVTGDIVVMFDADGSADPAEITRFVDALKAGADFAKGSRNTAGGGSSDITPVRHVGNRFLNTVFNVGFRTRFSDLCYGYNAFWADLIPLLDLPDHAQPASGTDRMLWGDGFEIETVITCRFAAARRGDHRGALDGEAADVRRVEPPRRLRRAAGAPDPVHRVAPRPGHAPARAQPRHHPSSRSSRARRPMLRTSQAA